MLRRTVAVFLAAAAVACATGAGVAGVSRVDPPPTGLPLPSGLRLVDARAGTRTTAYVWTATYAGPGRLRVLARYEERLRRLRYDVVAGPGAALTFPFRRWQAFACADPGCGAPAGRLTLVLGVPGG